MKLYIVFPNLVERTHPPSWVDREPGIWYAGLDLPPGPYWHPSEYREHSRRNIPALPGERLELVAVLTDDRPRSYQGIPLRTIRDRVRVLRRVRLTREYTYEELYHSPLYWQWLKEGILQAYNLREFVPVARRLPMHRQWEVC